MNVYSYIDMSIDSVIDVAKLLSDSTRVQILLALRDEQEMCVYEIAERVGASQSATSHQLAKLEARGVVECFREGQKMCYELRDSYLTKDIISMLSSLETRV